MTSKKKPAVTVTIKRSKDGSITMKSTGGYDLRKLMGPMKKEPTK